ncbi:MAG: hypothetical protein Q4P65_04415, partial [Eubacteriales bacterium]|nr:hypothetical protein [Eubacteriales bacterium]
MADEQRHYFNAPAGEGKVQTHLYEVGDIKLRLKTSAGIFAKRGLDFGTALLIEAILAKAQ